MTIQNCDRCGAWTDESEISISEVNERGQITNYCFQCAPECEMCGDPFVPDDDECICEKCEEVRR